MYNNHTEIQAQDDYQKALSQAFWRKVRKWLGRGCNDLLSYNEVFQYLKKRLLIILLAGAVQLIDYR